LVVRDPGGQVVVNVNDNDFHADMVGQIRDYGGPNPEIALLGYTGAGPYPQTYYDDPCVLMQRAAEKKLEFFRRYRIMRDAINPKVAVPFAGKYWLGGKLVDLKAFRGVADAVEVLEFDDRAVVLADGGAASIDTATLQPTAVRTQGYEPESIKAFLESIRSAPMDYERNFRSLSTQRVPYRSLLLRSYENALKRSMCQSDYYLGVVLSDCVFVCNANANNSQYWFRTDMVGLEPRSEVRVDLRYLFGLITRVYHWNNAEIGSHLTVQRVPDVFDRTAQHFLDFFYV
ncbi:MAG TPA: hypothetical protein VHO25_12940, partial [Polyangiaceae bacterium]|nr:hypothetical protein [Polyangiaceae bacterium]